MSKVKFPMLVKRGLAVVKIYHTPEKKRIKGGSKSVSYDAYTVVYTFGGKRVRQRFSKLEEARAEADKAALAVANGGMDTRLLNPDQVREYCAATESLDGLGVDLTSAISEYVQAKRAAGDANLVQIAQFHKRYAGDKIVRTKVPALVDALLQQKRDEGAGDYHINDLTTRLKKFKEEFTGYIDEITTEQINSWLKGLGLEPRTQNNYRATVVQLFNYAKVNGKALAHWLPHAAEAAIRVKEPTKETEIYTPAEMQKILDGLSGEMRLLVAIRAFSGIRNEEMFKLSWDEVDLQAGWLKLKRATTKLRARRIIPITENLKAWIGDSAKKTGKVQDYSSAKTMSAAIAAAIGGTGVPMKRNALRNCYTSYRLGILGDTAKVAEETGNSPQVIREEYLELVTPEQGREWFQISPKKT